MSVFLWAIGLARPLTRLQGADEHSWTRVSEGGLSIYTQGDPAEAQALLEGFASMERALLEASPFELNPKAALKIIRFSSAQEFAHYRINPSSSAFYQQTGRSEFIVLNALQAEGREISYHEFTHFLLAHSGLKLPLWLNEGLAEFYSTFEVSGDRVVFGRSVPGRLPVLRSQAWLPLRTLFGVTTTSPYYSQADRMRLFYAESWALSHMLESSPVYRARFPYFLHALNSHDTAESLLLIYNRTPEQVEQELRDYLDAQHLPQMEAGLKPVAEGQRVCTAKRVSQAEMDVTLSDLSVTNPVYRAGLETRLASAASQMPESAEAEEAIGFLAFREGRHEEARVHFQRAVERNSGDANVYLYLAHLLNEAGTPGRETMPLLERALALKPDLGEARLELGLIATGEGEYRKGLEVLAAAQEIRPENAYAAAYAKAYCYAHLDEYGPARQSTEEARRLATNERDRAEVAELLQFIAQNESDR